MSEAADLKVNIDDAKAEIIAAEGLRASHEIISALEKCKSSSELILDQLPDLLVIMTKEGRILKGNHAASELLECGTEDILNRNFYDAFRTETENIFKSRMTSLVKDRKINQLQFELPIINDSNEVIEYLWTISIFNQVSERRGVLLKVLGKNISKIKEFEKKLSQIFSAIPLGIFTVNGKGKIEWPYSLFTEFLLGQDKLFEKDLEKVLFEPIWGSLDSIQKAGASQVLECIGGEVLWFDMAKIHFPNEVQLKRQTSDGDQYCWLGITYHPIVIENIIEKLMIVLEDRTEVVEARRALEIQKEIENNRNKKIIEIQKCSGTLLESTFNDIDKLLPRIEIEFQQKQFQKAAHSLYSMKVIARTAGFSDLEHHAQSTEDYILQKITNNKINVDWIMQDFASFKKEFNDLKSLCFNLSGRQFGLQLKQADYMEIIHELKDLKKSSDEKTRAHADNILKKLGGGSFTEKAALSSLEERLLKQASLLAQKLGKKVKLFFDWNNIYVIQSEILTFSEIFIHLLNNAIDHGIENPEERVKKGKKKHGSIVLKALKLKNYIKISINDDGIGIEKEKIVQVALRRELVNEKQINKFKNDDIYELMLLPGFSTRDKTDNISGRGIGLNSVDDAARSLGCSKILISSNIHKGTTISFDVPSTNAD